jgi:predicted nucleotidyltransferase
MMTIAERIQGMRKATGLTQVQFAERAGISQPKLSAYERGVVEPSPPTIERIERAARLRPSVMLERHADEIRNLARRYRISKVRVFGSSVHGTDTTDSDVDLLVSFDDDTSLFDVAGFALASEELLGYPVDVVSDAAPSNRILERILAEAVPL